MTLPNERFNSLRLARSFLRALLDSKKTPRVPRIIRMEARWVLKHFPHDYELQKLAKFDKKGEILEDTISEE